jgi:hypothetical protein
VTLLPEQSIPCSPPLLAHTPDALVVGPEAAPEGEGAAEVGGVAAAVGEEAEGGGPPERGGVAEVGGAAEGGGAERAEERNSQRYGLENKSCERRVTKEPSRLYVCVTCMRVGV